MRDTAVIRLAARSDHRRVTAAAQIDDLPMHCLQLTRYTAFGFVDVGAEPPPELAIGDGLVYFITARRA
jgi:hypothetical protein